MTAQDVFTEQFVHAQADVTRHGARLNTEVRSVGVRDEIFSWHIVPVAQKNY